MTEKDWQETNHSLEVQLNEIVMLNFNEISRYPMGYFFFLTIFFVLQI